MIYLFLFLIFILMIYNIKHNSKIALLLIWICLGGICYISTNLPDMDNYSTFYDNVGKGADSNVLGIGWLYLCKLGNALKLNYISFKTIIYMISIVLLYLTIKNLTSNNRSKILALYLIFPGLLDLVQIRFFFASSIILLFLVKMLKNPTFKSCLIYLFMNIMAITIHSSCSFYLIFILIPLILKVPFQTIITLFFFWMIASIIMIPYLENILNFILPSSQTARVEAYFSEGIISFPAMMVYTLLFIINFVLSYSILKNVKILHNECNLFKSISIIYLLLMLSLPLVFVTSDFLRVSRPFILFNYFLYLGYSEQIKNKKISLGKFLYNYNRLFWINYSLNFLMFIIIFNMPTILSFFKIKGVL